MTDSVREAGKCEELRAALRDFVAAVEAVQEYWSDPGSYTHNRLLAPMLIHEAIIRMVKAP